MKKYRSPKGERVRIVRNWDSGQYAIIYSDSEGRGESRVGLADTKAQAKRLANNIRRRRMRGLLLRGV